jgi:uncharacterized protein
VIIVWDEPKREANLDKHGIDFAAINESFFLTAIVRPARNGRFAAIGRVDDVIVVIFALLGTEGISLVSARPASRKERLMLP